MATDPSLSAAYRAVSVTFRTLIRKSKVMERVLKDAERIAPSSVNCLLLGETGTGKNLIAQAIHNASPRAGGPFVSLNCSAIPDTLLETELFGAEEGAYTDSRRLRRGRFELADHGTLFLDEIGDLSAQAQAKILHALEYKEFTRVGGEKTLTSDVRIVAATNLPLDQRVESGQFRRDLLFRLNEAVIEVPPLRDRIDDLPDLAEAFIEECNAKYGKRVKRLDKATLKLLLQHHWPGNVRELRSVIKRGVARCESDTLNLDDLQLKLQLVEAPPLTSDTSGAPGSGLTLAEAERAHLLRVLSLCGWVKSEAARLLDIARPTLDRKIQQYGLSHDSE